MYLSATNQKIQVVLSGAVTANQLLCIASYQDITSTGMTIPQESNQSLTNDTTAVDLVASPSASTNRQVVHITIYNADTASATVTVQKDVAGTDYVIIKQTLQAGSVMEWSREAGWKITESTDSPSVTFSTFTSNGTWTKPSGMKRAIIAAVGGGGGGGSGRQGAAGENRFGGGGGGGAALVIASIAAGALASTVSVTVGAGGTGGAGQASTSSNGNAGTAGGDTSFGGIVVSKGGSAGGAGATTAGTAGGGGAANASNPSYSPFALNGATGTAGTTNTASTAGGTGMLGNTACSGGAGGAGINNANTSAVSAGAGGGIYENGILYAGPTAGASPNGVNGKSKFLHMSTTLTSGTGIGTGGAGGYPAFKDGGTGGYGSGGGGGSGTLNGTTSGAGGTGGGGFVVVMELY